MYMYINICDDATRVVWWKTIKKRKRLKTCYMCHSCLGFVDSLEQYMASGALVSWFHCIITTI